MRNAIMVCEEIEGRVAKVWYRFQSMVHRRVGKISQIMLDELCVEDLEHFMDNLEVIEKSKSGELITNSIFLQLRKAKVCLPENDYFQVAQAVYKEAEKAFEEPDEEEDGWEELDGKDIMIYENGRDKPSYRCPCGCNVFRKLKNGKFKCNSCSGTFEGEPK